MTSRTWLSVEPLDTMMVRDGRSFVAGQDSASGSVTPSPSTLGGVVGKAVGGRVRGRLVGPVVQVRGGSLFPVPADVVRDEQVLRRLVVDERPDDEWWDLDDRRRLSHAVRGVGESMPESWISHEGLAAWLRGASGGMASGQPLDGALAGMLSSAGPWCSEPRIGLARRVRGRYARTVMPGMLYTAEHQRPVEGMRFVVGCDAPDPVAVATDVVPFGGQHRLARVRVDGFADPFPPPPDDFPGGRMAVYLATPAVVRDVLWSPPEGSAQLCAVALSGPHPVTTATPGDFGRTRRLLWTVPAGTVYYLRFGSADEAKRWSLDHHAGLLPSDTEDPIVTAGFGTCLTGSW